MWKRAKERYQAWNLKIVNLTIGEEERQKAEQEELVYGKGWEKTIIIIIT